MHMMTMKTEASEQDRSPILLLVLVSGWLFLLYGRALYQLTPDLLQPLWRLLGPLLLATDFLNPLFRSPLTFMIGYSFGMGVIAWGLLRYFRRPRRRRLLLAAGALGILFPLVMPLTYGAYQVPAAAREGYQLQWVTEPANSYSSAFKQAQLHHEGACDYRLSGWVSETGLAYTSACWPGGWQHDLATGETNWRLSAAAPTASGEVQQWDGSLYLTPPTGMEEAGAFPFLTLERAVSPDGMREAVVVRWFYGPSDVVVLSRADSIGSKN